MVLTHHFRQPLDARSFCQCRCSSFTVLLDAATGFGQSSSIRSPPPATKFLLALLARHSAGSATPPAPAAVHVGKLDAQVSSSRSRSDSDTFGCRARSPQTETPRARLRQGRPSASRSAFRSMISPLAPCEVVGQSQLTWTRFAVGIRTGPGFRRFSRASRSACSAAPPTVPVRHNANVLASACLLRRALSFDKSAHLLATRLHRGLAFAESSAASASTRRTLTVRRLMPQRSASDSRSV